MKLLLSNFSFLQKPPSRGFNRSKFIATVLTLCSIQLQTDLENPQLLRYLGLVNVITNYLILFWDVLCASVTIPSWSSLEVRKVLPLSRGKFIVQR